jgi:hypothetical protein
MSNPYKQVALTYLRRPFSSFRVFVMVFGFPAMMFLPYVGHTSASRAGHYNADQQANASPLLMTFFCGVAVLFGLAVIHIKEQFADPRARLMPGFRRTHIAGAVVAFLVLAILMPIALAWHAGMNMLGLTAIAVLWCGIIFWWVLLQSTIFSWLVNIIAFAIIFGLGASILNPLCFGEANDLAVLFLLGGLVAVCLGGYRMFQLNEDMPEYHRRLQTGWSQSGAMVRQVQPSGDILPQKLKDRFQARQMAGLVGHARRAAYSRWSRVCRWQVGMMTGWSVVAVSLGFVPVVSFVTSPIGGKGDAGRFAMTFSAMFAGVMPIALVWGGLWRRRLLTLQYESLLPADRAAYLKQVGAAAAINVFELWAGLSVASALWWKIAFPQQSLIGVSHVWAWSALWQVGFFGLAVWFLRFRSRWLAAVGIVVPIQIAVMLPMFLQVKTLSSWQSVVLPLSGIFAMIGVAFGWHGYRRWLVADFD